MFGKKAVLLYHKNLTVKIVMPLQDYKAQYSVKINIYFSSFIYFFFMEESGCIKIRGPFPLLKALERLDYPRSFIPICTKIRKRKK